MSSENDFLDLYRSLGVQPGCGLLTFKRAYRRHVSLLHPDRQPFATDSDDLQRLLVQYSAAMEFHRRHGRLPGASAPGRIAGGDAMAMPLRRPPPGHAPVRSRSMPVAIVGIALLGLAAWNLAPITSSNAATTPTEAGGERSGDDAPAPPTLALGMTAAEVREIEGEPMLVHGDRWEYGPSYVRFEGDVVVDWYSSPLRTLKVAVAKPRYR